MTPTAICDAELTPPRGGDIHDTLEALRELVEESRSMPLSNSAIVNRDEALELVEEIAERLPDELRKARWLLKEREEFLARSRREAEEIVASARARAEGMVSRTEVVREAQRVARITVEQAEAAGRQVRNQAEDYVDAKLAGFEVTMERALAAVQKGRKRLAAIDPVEVVHEDSALPSPSLLFDQDA
ncbi:MAG: hypothetical protein ACRDZ3_15915 [Acidimicrobiia bacterium]